MRSRYLFTFLVMLMIALIPQISSRAEDKAVPAKDEGQAKDAAKEAKKKVERLKVTIKGTVKDEDGKPVNEATVFVFAKDFDPTKKGENLYKCHQIAKTETFGNGEYEFKELDHPLLREPDKLAPALDIVVLAKDKRFTWRGPVMVYAAGDKRLEFDRKVIVPGNPAEINLEFRPTKPIAGHVLDEEGNPIAGAVIRLGDCRRNYREGVGTQPDNEWLNYCLGGKTCAAPDAIALRKSDAEGKFSFAEIPVDMRAMFFVFHDEFAMVGFGATNAEDEQAGVIEGGSKFQRGSVKIKMRKTFAVPVEVKLGDSDKPAAGAGVAGIEIVSGENQSSALGMVETDKNGRGTLKLPAGKFMLRAGYTGSPIDIPTTEIVVERANREKPIILRINGN
jgi:hypothetical protein